MFGTSVTFGAGTGVVFIDNLFNRESGLRFIAEKTYAVCPPKRVAFLGLGVMGYPMAAHLARAGHTVCVYNRHADKARQWVAQLGGTFAATPREAAAGADMVFCCVGNDDDLRSVVLGEQGGAGWNGRGCRAG